MGAAMDQETVAVALAAHLERNGLPLDGGASDAFAVVRLGPIPYPIPNTAARRRAVKLHDLNHLVTGYDTDLRGEAEISAWELASGGCQHYVAAWALDLTGLVLGLVVCPRRTLRAFRAGYQANNLYPYPAEQLLALPLREVVARVQSTPTRQTRRVPASVLLAASVLAALPTSLLFGLAWTLTMPWWLASTRRTRHHLAAMP
jgi:hypothetical protein